VRGEKVTAAFDDDRLISDGGVLVLAQAERMMGICERLAACFPDPHAVARVIYRLEDIPRARACECLARLSGLSPGAALASPPTMSRGENAPTTQELVKMLTAMIDISSASHPIARAAVRLDIDDTCDVVRGCQQLSFWNGHWRALFPADPCLCVHLIFFPCDTGRGRRPHGRIDDSEEAPAARRWQQACPASPERSGTG
jgi:hypothetical protein